MLAGRLAHVFAAALLLIPSPKGVRQNNKVAILQRYEGLGRMPDDDRRETKCELID
jgi:hypothetical protein